MGSDRKMNQDEGGGRDDRECDGGATAAAGDQPEEQPSGSKDKKVDQEEPTSSHTTTSTTKSSSISNNPTSSQKKSGMDDKAKLNKLMTTYDRLMPRYNSEAKRKMEDSESASSSEASSKAKKSCQNTAAKKEYSRLRTLVPALTEREDLSKVEIIEETIRYIDALHHQLASRGINPPNQSSETEEQQTQQPETNPENTSAEPLKALLSGDSSVARPRRIAATTGAQASGSSNISAETSNTVAPSSVITSSP